MGKINNSFKITRNKLNIVPSQKKKKKKKPNIGRVTFQGI